jgi:hypothetical protein
VAGPLDWLQQMLGGGDPEAEGAAQASMAMQPNVLGYAQNVLSGKYAREGVFGQPRPYDPALPYRQNVPDTRASLEPATDIAMGIGPGAIRAFHGSPHSFLPEPGYPLGRFDSSKIGTGEGAQAYSHGLYFGGVEPVAENYLGPAAGWKYGRTNAQTIYDRLNNPTLERGLDSAGWDKLNAQRGFWEKVVLGRAPRSIIDDARMNPDQFGAAELAYINSIDPARFKRTGGNMYEVDIHADPQRLLDWDKPLAQQSQQVRNILNENWWAHPEAHANQTGSQIYDAMIRDISPTGLSRLNAPVRVSQQLNEAGIPGVRYLDQWSRGAGQGTSNYVIYNDKLIEILRKYGILPPVAAGTAGGLLGPSGE